MLDRNPNTRLGSKTDVKEILAHPFFKGVDVPGILEKKVASPYIPKEELYTFKEENIDLGDARFKSIGREDEEDQIPEDRKAYI